MMSISEIAIWIVAWIVGTLVSIIIFYYVNNKVTLSDAIASVLLWWVIIPCYGFIGFAMCFVWVCTKAGEITLIERKNWWMTKEDRKKINEQNKKKTLTFNNILKK